MGIDVGSADRRAGDLREYASQLQVAKTNLTQYRSMIETNWQGQEVAYYINAIISAQNRLQTASNELHSIASSVSSTAQQIWEEEEAERRRQEAEEQARREAEEAARIAALAAASAAGSRR